MVVLVSKLSKIPSENGELTGPPGHVPDRGFTSSFKCSDVHSDVHHIILKTYLIDFNCIILYQSNHLFLVNHAIVVTAVKQCMCFLNIGTIIAPTDGTITVCFMFGSPLGN